MACLNIINLNVGPFVRLLDTFKFFIFQIIPAVRCRLYFKISTKLLSESIFIKIYCILNTGQQYGRTYFREDESSEAATRVRGINNIRPDILK